MRNYIVFGLLVILSLSAFRAEAWEFPKLKNLWKFQYGESNTNKPPRLHRLLEAANDEIELAEDASLEGDGDKAIEHYKKAIEELEKVKREHPDRAEKPEFTPLRNKEAACRAAIDSIRFDQINQNIRAVTVSDTSELQKKWNKKHGIKNPEDEKEEPKTIKEEVVKQHTDLDVKTNKVDVVEKVEKVEPVDSAIDSTSPEQIEKSKPKGMDELIAANQLMATELPKDWNERIKFAVKTMKSGDYDLADQLLEKLQNEQPKNLNVLLLRAAAQAGAKKLYTARRTLETAMRTHPKSYLPYYNLAHLTIRLGESVETAKQYYEMGRMVGGPVNSQIETLLKSSK